MSTSSATSSLTTTIAPTDLAGQNSQQRQIGQKRKAADAGINSGTSNPGRVTRARFFTKRRAAKACQCCRARKVRCNVTEHGAPCTNCRLDEVECVVSEGRRKRKLPGLGNKNGSINVIIPQCTKKEQPRRLSSHSSVTDWLDDESNSEEYGYSHADHYPKQDLELPLDNNLSADIGNKVDPALIANPSTSLPEINQSFTNCFTPQIATNPLSLPKYVNPVINRLEPDEIDFLHRKGALFVPDGTVLKEFLRCFVEFVHHSNPVIELHDYLNVIQSDGNGTGKVSLLVLQAILYSASAFVDIRVLRNTGYKSRKEARQYFYSKVKLLYDFGYETDRLALVQAISLITDHYERPNDLKDAHYWLGIAVSIAKSIGLQQDLDETQLSARDVKLRKRLWWSLVVRDRLVALGMRRPTLIKTEDYDISALTVDDLQFAPLPEHLTSMIQKCGSARDVQAQRRLAVLYVQKVKLCCIIGNVLHKTYYVTNESRTSETNKTNMMLRPRTTNLPANEVRECHTELYVWLEGLPKEASLNDNEDGFSDYVSVTLNRALLHMLFHAAISALHRPQVLLNNSSQNCMNPTPPTSPKQIEAAEISNNYEMLETSRRSIRHSTSSITAIAAQLNKSGLARYLPITGITVLVAAMVIHLLDLKSPTSEVGGLDAMNGVKEGKSPRADALMGFCTCMSVMRGLSDMYAAADVSTVFLDAAVCRARISLARLEGDMRHVGDGVATSATTEGAKEEYVSSAAGLLITGQRLLGFPLVSNVPSSPSPIPPEPAAAPVTSNYPSTISPNYPTYYAASLANGYQPYQTNGFDFMTVPAQTKDYIRGRTTLSSLTPPPEESLPFASSLSSNMTLNTQLQQQQQQQQQQQTSTNFPATATNYENRNNKIHENSVATSFNSEDVDMARRLERYLAGYPFSSLSSPPTPSATTTATTATTANHFIPDDSSSPLSSSFGSRAGIRAESTGKGMDQLLPGSADTGTDAGAGTGSTGNGTDGTAAFYGQLESEFDALIDLSGAATAATADGNDDNDRNVSEGNGV